MKSNLVVLITTFLFVVNMTVPATLVFADVTPSNPLLKNVITLEASVDSGQVKLEDAINTFSANVINDNISIDSVEALALSKMSPEQFADFKANIDSSLRGIDPTTLTQQELGTIVGQVIAGTKTQGLYWDGCVVMYSGITLAVASVIVGVIGILNLNATSKIDAKVAELKANAQPNIDNGNKQITTNTQQNAQNDANFNADIQGAQQALANSNTTVAQNVASEASNIQNWQTVYPQAIANATNRISTDSAQISSLAAQLSSYTSAYANDPNTLVQYQSQLGAQISSYQNDLNNAAAQAASYSSAMTTYTNNPAQVAADIAALNASLPTLQANAIANFQSDIQSYQNQESANDANVSSQNAALQAQITTEQNSLAASITQVTQQQNAKSVLGKNLGIAGGIGAAVSAAMITAGALTSGDCSD